MYNEAAGKKIGGAQNLLELLYDKITDDLDKIDYWYRKTAEDDNKVAVGDDEDLDRAFEFSGNQPITI